MKISINHVFIFILLASNSTQAYHPKHEAPQVSITDQTEILENKNTTTIILKDNKTINHNVSFWHKVTNFSKWLQTLLRTSESIPLRLILIFLLGLLMSLTPCIYPMLPITAGILQAQGSHSLGRSFIMALSYTLGTSTTFAIFGLIAALTGHLFGQLLVSPIFILLIVALLTYLGLSMFGLYDMYVPKFMSESKYSQKKGSLLSVFAFGMVSGSMASPCLSPGLALLLSIVAAQGSNLLGFVMLFIFGLGLSVPLLIIGTFSNSINILPQSGIWMVEIKKLFGFMLLGMCLYLLTNILPMYLISWLIKLFIFGSGVYYIQNVSKYDGKSWYFIKHVLGSILIMISIFMSIQAIYKTYFNDILHSEKSSWETDYDIAINKAQKHNCKLLIDCGADWCSICKAIDKTVFENNQVKTIMDNLITLKVNVTNQKSEPYHTLKNTYAIIGVPTILIIEPTTKSLLARWGSDLYDMPIDQFIAQIEQVI